MKITSEQSKERLLSDYGKLEKNKFWEYFWINVEENRKSILEALGGAINENESALRARQGNIQAFNALKDLPAALVKIIAGEPETAPTGEEYE